jgi:hypothetical protein
LLHLGANTVDISFAGNVELDRLQLELDSGGLLSDGFESGRPDAWSGALGG